MEAITDTALHEAVAANLSLSSGDIGASEQSHIENWALDCLRTLLPMAPDSAVESYYTTTATQASGVAISTLTGCLKIARVSTSAGDYCRQISAQRMESIRNTYGSPTNPFGAGQRVWANIMGTVVVWKVTGSVVTIEWIPDPGWSGGSLNIPNGWQGILADYCTMRAKMKREQPKQAMALYKIWREGLQMKLGGYADFQKNTGG